jgi:hypothetical protein
MHWQPETQSYYDPMKDDQFQELIAAARGDRMAAFHAIVNHGKPRVLGVSWDEALAREIPANATFIGNLTWPQNAYDGTNMEHLVSSMRNWGTTMVGPPGTARYVNIGTPNERPGLKADQGVYENNKDQVGFYHVFKDAPTI